MNKKVLIFFLLITGMSTVLTARQTSVFTPTRENNFSLTAPGNKPLIAHGTAWKDYTNHNNLMVSASQKFGTTSVADVATPTERRGILFITQMSDVSVGYYWCFNDDLVYELAETPKKLFLLATPKYLTSHYGITPEAAQEAHKRKQSPLLQAPSWWTPSKKIAVSVAGIALAIIGYRWLKSIPAAIQPSAPTPLKQLTELQKAELYHGPFRPYTPIASHIVDPAHIPSEIKGKQITLRKLTMNDVQEYDAMMTEQTMQSLYQDGLSLTKTPGFTRSQLAYSVQSMDAGKMMSYVIIDNATQKLIGGMGAYFEHDPQESSLVSQWLNENYRGNGYVPEALHLLTKTYFELTGEQRVSANARVLNTPSVRALTKAGFTIVDHIIKQEYRRPGDKYILELQQA